METTPQMVREAVVRLRQRVPLPQERRLAALRELWQRLPEQPPGETGAFPWAQVRRGVEALARSAPRCLEPLVVENPGVLALILAGNTPLLAWPVLHYSVLLGIPVFIKQSRDETIWTRHFVETLASIDVDVAAALHLELFPGDSPQTETLLKEVDAVIAYGSDTSIAALRAWTPQKTPFQGFGHAISIGIWLGGDPSGFVDDVLIYDQGGCLSLQVLYAAPPTSDLIVGLSHAFERAARPPRSDPGLCYLVRQCRALAKMEFGGLGVFGEDESLWWSLIYHLMPRPIPPLTGLGMLHVLPLPTDREAWGRLPELFGEYRGKVSCVGVVGELPNDMRAVLEAEGVSRICGAGEMQTPPLDWENGGVDLRWWLSQCIFQGG